MNLNEVVERRKWACAWRAATRIFLFLRERLGWRCLDLDQLRTSTHARQIDRRAGGGRPGCTAVQNRRDRGSAATVISSRPKIVNHRHGSNAACRRQRALRRFTAPHVSFATSIRSRPPMAADARRIRFQNADMARTAYRRDGRPHEGATPWARCILELRPVRIYQPVVRRRGREQLRASRLSLPNAYDRSSRS